MTVTGYLSSLSVRQGERIDCMVSATASEVTLDVVRLLHGDDNPEGPGRKVFDVAEIPAVRAPGGLQDVHLGSCVVVPTVGFQPLIGLELDVLIHPTMPRSGKVQTIASLLGAGEGPVLTIAISIEGRLVVTGDAGVSLCSLEVPWRRGSWYRLVMGIAADGTVVLTCTQLHDGGESAVGRTEGDRVATGEAALAVVFAASTCRRVGEQWIPRKVFNGKLEHPVLRRVDGGGLRSVIADWRFEQSLHGAVCEDTGGGEYDGIVVNAPLRAATGHNWVGREIDYRRIPEQYGAIHFHDDDLDDAAWIPNATITIPDGLASGVYAVRIAAGSEVDHVPFVVVPAPGAPRERIAVLLPTFTYIAYANERMVTRLDFEGDQMSDHPIHPGNRDIELAQHPEWGLSLYDVHSDGSTCVYSTSLRPIPNLRLDYRAWLQNAPRHLSADLYLVDWLTERGYGFDVITDHDVNRDGMRLLDDYDLIITGSHPEYVSERMLDALDSHVNTGGSLMYLGGNGFYWVTSQDEDRPHLIEVRRGAVGTRPSEGAPGEGHHSTTGETGGLWRERGRWPNRLTGIGMTAQGWDSKAPGYRRTDEGRATEFDFVFEGVEEDVIGDFGLIMNGASGDELDRFDLDRGSPPETVVLATTTGHSDFYQLVGEDVLASRAGLGGTESPEVRSDMTWLEKPAGGAVFSIGSICYTGSLSHNGYRNNVSAVTGNVIDEMLRRPGKSGPSS